MIIRRITISSWRAIERFDCELEPGLNLLRGPNEAGKSSIVEAIGWALHRDLVGGARIKDEITPIIPANDSQARPQVELLLEFPDCTAIIRKTLAEDSSRRECTLVLQRPGQVDESFDQSAAQTQLRKLMDCDGCSTSESTSGGLDGELLLSAQGASTSFVGRELSSAARAAVNSVALGEGGILAPTSRLEKVRTLLQKLRTDELFSSLKSNAIDSAKKQTTAAHVREELKSLREEHAKHLAIESQIGALREKIETLKTELSQLEPLIQSTERELQTLRVRQKQQLESSRDLAEKRRAYNETKSQYDELLRLTDEIARWSQTETRSEYELQSSQTELEVLEEKLVELKGKQEAAWQAQQQNEIKIQDARQKARAWELAHDVCAAFRERHQIEKRIKQLEVAQHELDQQKQKVASLGEAPTAFQLGQWQRVYDELQRGQSTDAHSAIRLTLRTEREIELTWQTDADRNNTDNGSEQTGTTGKNEPFIIEGTRSLAIIIPEIGRIEVDTENREFYKRAAELETKTRTLQTQLQKFGVLWDELPAAFKTLEEQQEKIAATEQDFRNAQQRFQSTLEAGENLNEARELFTYWDTRWKESKKACADTQDSALEELKQSESSAREKEARARRESERWRNTEAEFHQQNIQLQEAARLALSQLHTAEHRRELLQNKGQAAREALLQARQRLTELQKDGIDAQTRVKKQEELNHKLLDAKRAQDNAIKHHESLGAAISEELLQHTAHELEQYRTEGQRLQTEIAAQRAELRTHCEQDPQTELQRLEIEIENCETEALRHESRLRGIGVLTAALEAERHRLGRELGAPLNRFLSPWVSELRGKETHLEFDENGSRIVGIRTDQEGKVHLLPFGSHSGGMQEQTALVLRLILARLAAQKLPSSRLPVILDDPLTQTDTLRRGGLWRVLDEASKELQILFVTCHESHLPAVEAHTITVGNWPQNADRNPQALPKVKPVAKPGTRTKKVPPKLKEEKNEALTLW